MTARPDQQDSQKGLFPTSAVHGHPTLTKPGPRPVKSEQLPQGSSLLLTSAIQQSGADFTAADLMTAAPVDRGARA
jgi:hypothetical protein